MLLTRKQRSRSNNRLWRDNSGIKKGLNRVRNDWKMRPWAIGITSQTVILLRVRIIHNMSICHNYTDVADIVKPDLKIFESRGAKGERWRY
jgi:hypothetical protein